MLLILVGLVVIGWYLGLATRSLYIKIRLRHCFSMSYTVSGLCLPALLFVICWWSRFESFLLILLGFGLCVQNKCICTDLRLKSMLKRLEFKSSIQRANQCVKRISAARVMASLSRSLDRRSLRLIAHSLDRSLERSLCRSIAPSHARSPLN